MAQHVESDFILPALKVIKRNGGKCLMSDIKNQITDFIVLSPEDLLPSPTRNEEKYRQIVGNLTSHDNSGFFKYVDKVVIPGYETSVSPRYYYILNKEGKELLSVDEDGMTLDFLDDVEEEQLLDDANILDADELEELNNRVVDLSVKTTYSNRPKTDPRISKTVIVSSGYKCLFSKLSGISHITFDTKKGFQYIEAHHFIPMKASKDFYPLNLDRTSNIVPLCPMCHAQVHHGSLIEKEKILKVLYENLIDKLNDEGIYISFEDLMNKYYL